jgi:hypothetical protein
MTYSTPLKSKLALGIDDVKEEGKLVRFWPICRPGS